MNGIAGSGGCGEWATRRGHTNEIAGRGPRGWGHTNGTARRGPWSKFWSHHPGLNRGPRPYHGRALPAEL